MKTLKTPTRAIRRMKAILLDKDGSICPIAAAIGPPYDFEINDTTVAILYTACDNADNPVGSWVWEGEEWQDLRFDEAAKVLSKWQSINAPKPEPKPIVIDCKLYRAAEDFSAAYAAKASGP
jgi:hypothetical protein